MSVTSGGNVSAAGDPARFGRAYDAIRADGSIQFDLPVAQPPQVPGWLRWLDQMLAGSGPFWKGFFWVAAAAALLLVLYALVRWFEGRGFALFRRRGAAGEPGAEEEWRIDEAPARALLAEADALAQTGRFAEAVHLLLFRSIEEIDRRSPAFLKPALTSRDIAAAPELPSGPRSAFARIAMAVERSLFGGRSLAERDWSECRAAYEEFALSRGWSR